jgi:hypothetical protein
MTVYVVMIVAYLFLLTRISLMMLFLQSTIYNLFLAADQARHLQDQMSGAAMAMPPDPKAAFKAEWEALEICEHHWALANIENEILGLAGPPADSMYHQNKVD